MHLPKQSKVVFSYTYQYGMRRKFAKAYKLLGETDNHVLIKHWYGKRWHPKNDYWIVEEVS